MKRNKIKPLHIYAVELERDEDSDSSTSFTITSPGIVCRENEYDLDLGGGIVLTCQHKVARVMEIDPATEPRREDSLPSARFPKGCVVAMQVVGERSLRGKVIESPLKTDTEPGVDYNLVKVRITKGFSPNAQPGSTRIVHCSWLTKLKE